MKSLSKVVWSEGMYISPQHFQAQSRFYEDTIDFVTRSLWAEPWGLLHARLDGDALRNGRVVLLEASGIFEDGLAFESNGRTPVAPPRNADELLLPTEASILLHLAVPGIRASGQVYGSLDATKEERNEDAIRFRTIARTLRDNTNGIDEREVILGEGNLTLLTEREITPQMSTIPFARLLRDGNGGLLYDPEYIAPTLRMAASPPLMLIGKRLIESLAEKSGPLSRSMQRRGRFEAGTAPLDVATYWFLHALSTAAPVLRHLYTTRHAHPEQLYLELSRLAGALSTFATQTSLDELPAYNHRDPGPAFRALDAYIKKHLELIVPTNTVTLTFTSDKPYFYEADVLDERCLRRARWVLGIRANLGEADLMASVPRLIKVCSARFVPELVRRALPGLALLHIPTPPAAIRAEADKQYFSIDLSGPCWDHILQTRRVGIYIPGEIAEPDFDLTVIVEPTP
ncbi:type VI secretion system baseplate subunit TssK [Granulicella sp. dw_53]|uniref:type VI secretion system baseplate subunit TssK n=1 Tax=Granulicella sp. dw_53 TaxID=2719792 RepID=UPI001BD63AC3|nr:type VI secretion system baseplate subunit TssK [Granulicella sp. dw_53]